ncbi:MAG: hypothetical protein K2M34_00235 [Alphaproteobacteria bacterium]|nr:hypothetical protein [Alphaproteobacteria bacterium]
MMTCNEFLTLIKSHGASIAPGSTPGQITITNTYLQRMRAAMLPSYMTELYATTGGINIGTGYIFGPTDVRYNVQGYPVPSIMTINQDLVSISAMRGKTVFGRNDLFWFAFDAFGTCYMLDNLSLRPLRKYDDPFRAMTDCLAAGKI